MESGIFSSMNLPCKNLKTVADVFQCKEFVPFGWSTHPRLSCGDKGGGRGAPGRTERQ